MNRQVGLGALFGVLATIFAFAAAAAEQDDNKWIPLRDNLQARLLSAFEYTPDSGGERELVVNFMLSDTTVIADHTKVIDVADQLFGRVVLKPSEEKGYKRAAVNLLVSEKKSGDTTLQQYEDFHYARSDNTVWLRQAGPEAWKVAQDPAAWTPPKSEEVKLSSSTVYVDFVGEIFPPAGAKRAMGIELHSSTPLLDVQAKYAEMKELWSRFNQAKLKEQGFDAVRMENYGEAARGRFQVRQMVYLNIRREPNGEWPALPDQMPGAPIIAGLPPGVDEATRFAAAAVASVVPASPTVPVAASRENVTTGTGTAMDVTKPVALGDYLTAP